MIRITRTTTMIMMTTTMIMMITTRNPIKIRITAMPRTTPQTV